MAEPAADAGAALAAGRHRGSRAVERMVECAPSTGGLALWVGHRDLPAGPAADAAPAAATDGVGICYGPRFDALPLAAQVGLVAHAVLHIALRHPQRLRDLRQQLGDVDAQLFNCCADAIVNSALGHLGWLTLPAGAPTLERLLASALGLSQGPEAALLAWDVERLYRAVDDRRAPAAGRAGDRDRDATPPRTGQAGRAGQSGQSGRPDRQATGTGQAGQPGQAGRSGGAGDQGRSLAQDQAGGRAEGGGGPGTAALSTHERTNAGVGASPAPRADGPRAARTRALAGVEDLLPEAAGAAGQPQDEAELTRLWHERIVRAHAGDGAFSMLRGLLADLPRSRTPWPQVLRSRLTRSLAPLPALSWSRPTRSYLANQGRAGPHRRMPWEPGSLPSRSAPRLVVVVDVSGSVEDALLARFAREIEAITRRTGAGLVLVVGDDRVRRVQRCAPGASDLRSIAFHGGGGTDFSPLLEEADRHRPDIGVVLTDLQGPNRFVPRWPVVWAVPGRQAPPEPPFGRLLLLD